MVWCILEKGGDHPTTWFPRQTREDWLIADDICSKTLDVCFSAITMKVCRLGLSDCFWGITWTLIFHPYRNSGKSKPDRRQIKRWVKSSTKPVIIDFHAIAKVKKGSLNSPNTEQVNLCQANDTGKEKKKTFCKQCFRTPKSSWDKPYLKHEILPRWDR